MTEYLSIIIPDPYNDPILYLFTSIPLVTQLVLVLFLGINFIIYAVPFIVFYPFILGFKLNLKGYANYLDRIGLSWLKDLLKYIIIGIISTVLIVTFYLVYYYISPLYFDGSFTIINRTIYYGLKNLIQIFWQEVVFHGILLTILFQCIENKKIAIYINALFFSIYYIIRLNTILLPTYYPYLTLFYMRNASLMFLITDAVIIYISFTITGYLFYRTKSLISFIVFYVFIMYISSELPYLMFPLMN